MTTFTVGYFVGGRRVPCRGVVHRPPTVPIDTVPRREIGAFDIQPALNTGDVGYLTSSIAFIVG
jgi:hypothetical protein